MGILDAAGGRLLGVWSWSNWALPVGGRYRIYGTLEPRPGNSKEGMDMGAIRWMVALGAAVAIVSGVSGQDAPKPSEPVPASPAAPEMQPPRPGQAEQPVTTPPASPAAVTPAPLTVQPDGEREVTVTLRDGQRYTGVLVSRDDTGVVIQIAGIETKIKSAQIERVTVLPSNQERYEQLRVAIEDADVEGLLRLVEWLRSKSMWDEALVELERVLAQQPDHPKALEARVLVQQQLELARKSGSGKRPPPPRTRPRAEGENGFPLLTERDINVIKVYEVDLTDPPRLLVDRETIKALITKYEHDPLMPSSPEGRDALYRASGARLLDLMFRMQARELYERVKVVDQPRSMKLFRDRVHRAWLINACATTRCHGGSEAGRLMLTNQKPGSDASLYTNFLILDRYRMRDGRPLINYDDPAKSVLLQMGMARERSSARHPEVAGMQGNADLFRPVFKNEQDARFEDAVEWIKAMYRPRPAYPVEYAMPGPEPVIPVDPKAPPVTR